MVCKVSTGSHTRLSFPRQTCLVDNDGAGQSFVFMLLSAQVAGLARSRSSSHSETPHPHVVLPVVCARDAMGLRVCSICRSKMDVVIKSLLRSPNLDGSRACASDCLARTRLLGGFSNPGEAICSIYVELERVEDDSYRDIDHRHRKSKDKHEISPKFDSKSRLAT